MTNPPFTGCWHPRFTFAQREEEELTPDGVCVRTITTATCKECGQVTAQFDGCLPIFQLPPRQFAVISSDPCPECSGKGVRTDYDGQDRAVSIRCAACRGTGGVLVMLSDALACQNPTPQPPER
jgi:hypothetical protein